MNFLFHVKRRFFTDLDREQECMMDMAAHNCTVFFRDMSVYWIEFGNSPPKKTHNFPNESGGFLFPSNLGMLDSSACGDLFFVSDFIWQLHQHLQTGANSNPPRDGEVTLFRNHLAPLWKCWQLSPSIFSQINHWRTYMELFSGNLVRLVHVSTQPATSGPGCRQHWGAAGGHEKCQVHWGLGSGCRGMVSRTRSWASRRGGLARQVFFGGMLGREGVCVLGMEKKTNICTIWGNKETKRLLEKLWLVSEYSELSIDCAVLNSLIWFRNLSIFSPCTVGPVKKTK